MMFTSGRLVVSLIFYLIIHSVQGDSTVQNWTTLNDCVDKFPEIETYTCAFGFAGTPALKHEFPHAAALGWTQADNEIRWACGGSLITEDTVLTAAHCTLDRSGKSPDKVRLGDLNLETDDDETETQQFDVKTIIRHPQYSSRTRYHDIALIKLQSSVNVTKFVCSACLWSNSEINKYTMLEACGFGQTEFGGPISPILNKIVVTPFNNKDCGEHYAGDRKLPQGIINSHLCASDKTGKLMDTCEGDSGGPIEMKLLLEETTIPFIVGITAFGKGCGSDSPGVYTRISSYIDWIEKETDVIRNPLECALKYKEFRYNNIYRPLSQPSPAQKQILGEKTGEECPGLLLTNTYLIASASCLSNMLNPNRVVVFEGEHQISAIFYHPDFNKYIPTKANVALIQVKTEIKYGQHNRPTCLSKTNYSPNPQVINHEAYTVSNKILSRAVSSWNLANCFDYYHINDASKYDEALTCFSSEVLHVPGSCQIPLGSGIIERNLLDKNQLITITRGLAVQSEDCGPVLVTNLASYIDWMDTIIFQKPPPIMKAANVDIAVLFYDSELGIHDDCSIPGTSLNGRCVSKEQCPNISDKPVLICGGSKPTTMCCPFS